MGYVPVDVPAFGGLDLRDPEDATGSPDLLNVFERRPGELSSRCGIATTGSTNLGTTPKAAAARTASALVFAYDTTIRSLSTAGTSSAETTGLTGGSWSLAALGGAVYCANGANLILKAASSHTAGTSLASTKASGASSFTGSRAMPVAQCVAVQPGDNRLVAAGIPTAAGPNAISAVTGSSGVSQSLDGSYVFFSQPEQPTYWDETDWVALDPGDGEAITDAKAWQNQLFISKYSKFYVFYGNSTDTDGGALFNYRRVTGLPTGSASYMVPHATGMFIYGNGGVWVTTGGPPTRVSGPVQPYFDNGTYTVGDNTAFTYGSLVFFPIRVSAQIFAGYWLVYDTSSQKWWLWRYLDGNAYLNCGVESGGYLYGPRDNQTGIIKFNPYGTTATDGGTSFTSRYQSPYSALGSPGVEKTIRQTAFHGTGTVDVSWGKDLQSHGYARSVTMLNGRGLDRTAVRGEALSWKVSGTGSWSLNRVIPFVREQRASGVKT